MGKWGSITASTAAFDAPWLCGQDPVTGKSYEHRQDWIRDRLEELAASFAVDVCGSPDAPTEQILVAEDFGREDTGAKNFSMTQPFWRAVCMSI